MTLYDRDFDKIIEKALNILFSKGTDIYTFALYYDHESSAVSVCVDTKINSKSVARKSNEFAFQTLKNAISEKNMDRAKIFGRCSERSFSLGDFKVRSLGWEPMKAPNNSAPFYLALVEVLFRNSKKIAALSNTPDELVLCCSTNDSEVGLAWIYQGD